MKTWTNKFKNVVIIDEPLSDKKRKVINERFNKTIRSRLKRLVESEF